MGHSNEQMNAMLRGIQPNADQNTEQSTNTEAQQVEQPKVRGNAGAGARNTSASYKMNMNDVLKGNLDMNGFPRKK